MLAFETIASVLLLEKSRACLLAVAAPGQLIDRIIIGSVSGSVDVIADDDDDLLEIPFREVLMLWDSLCVVMVVAPDAADLEPLFLTFVRIMKRQILGLPRTRRLCV